MFHRSQPIHNLEQPDAQYDYLLQLARDTNGQGSSRPFENILNRPYTRRRAIVLGVGATAAALIGQDQMDGEFFPNPDPDIDQTWVNPEARLWLPQTYIDIIPGFNNKSFRKIMENCQELLGQYGQFRRQWPGNKGIDIPGLSHATLTSYAPVIHKDSKQGRQQERQPGEGRRQVLLGHSMGGLMALAEAEELISQGVEVPLIVLFSTPYDGTCLVKDENIIGVFNWADDHNVRLGPIARWATEFMVNWKNGESIAESNRLARDSAYPDENRPYLSNGLVISQGAFINRRNGPRISPLLKNTRIVYIGSRNDSVVLCEKSSALFRAEHKANGGSYVSYPPVDAPHAGLDSKPDPYLDIIKFELAAAGFKTVDDLKQAADSEYYRRYPRLAKMEIAD